jgi:hypothetical protein
MHTDVAVFSSTAVSGALWVYGDVVERTEVTTHTTNFLHKDLVVEARFEFSLAGGCGGDVHGSLSSTEDNVVFYGGDGSAVEGCVGDIGFQDIQILSIDKLDNISSACAHSTTATYLCGLVLGGSDKV